MARASDVGEAPSEREIAGAYGAAATLLGSSAGARGGARARRGEIPTSRVGALVRALGAHVGAHEDDMLRRCEKIVDPEGRGSFALGRLRDALAALRDEGRLPTREEEGGKGTGEVAMTTPVVSTGRRATRATATATTTTDDRKSVLIVDDVASVRKFQAGQIGKMGYQSIEAGEGAEALRLYGENHAEIQGILMDLMMPTMDGYEIATGIRAMEEKQALRRMPIIAVTSLTDQELKEHASSVAFDCHVDKPTSMSKLATIFESMRMAPSLSAAELQAIGAANAAKLDPHGTKRSHLPVSSSDTTSDDGKHGGSNDGSSDQNGRKGSNSDADPDARSSGDSGNEQRYVSQRADGPCNSSKRPGATASGATAVAPKKTGTSDNGSGGNSNNGSSDASRQGVADDAEEKSTVDKAAPADRNTTKQLSPARGTQTGTKAHESTKTDTAVAAEAMGKTTTTQDRTTTGVNAVDAGSKPVESSHRPCARCGSEKTRFCYYNNGLPTQPRHYCRSCQRYWTEGGTQRNLPKGSGRRRVERPDSAAPLTAPVKDAAKKNALSTAAAIAHGANAQNEMQRAILVLMTQVVGFDVDHAANNAGMVASRAGEEVAQIVLQNLGHSSEAIEIAVTLAKTTGWRIGISVSAVATAAVSQGLNQAEIASLISTQLPFLANALVREVSEQVKTMELSRKSPTNDSDSGGSGGTGENGGKSATSAKSNSTLTGVKAEPATVASVQALQTQVTQRWLNDLQYVDDGNARQAASARVGAVAVQRPSASGSQPQPQGSGASNASAMPWTQGQTSRVTPVSSASGFQPALTSAFTPSMAAPRMAMNMFGAHPMMNQPMNPAWLSMMNRFGSSVQPSGAPSRGPGTPQAHEAFMKALDTLGGGSSEPPN